MIIGNGLMAATCASIDNDNIIIFASGVSNSGETNEAPYQREKKLLQQTILDNQEKTIIYFSTCSVYDPSKRTSRYVIHKLEMESIIKSGTPKYYILRVGNVVGPGGNIHTLFNNFKKIIKEGEAIRIFAKAKRLLIDAEDIPTTIQQIIMSKKINSTINVAFPHQFQPDAIVEAIAKKLSITPNIQIEDIGSNYDVNIEEIFFPEKHLPDAYLQKLVEKYI